MSKGPGCIVDYSVGPDRRLDNTGYLLQILFDERDDKKVAPALSSGLFDETESCATSDLERYPRRISNERAVGSGKNMSYAAQIPPPMIDRRLLAVVADRMTEAPVVVLQGARSVGKSTVLAELARQHERQLLVGRPFCWQIGMA